MLMHGRPDCVHGMCLVRHAGLESAKHSAVKSLPVDHFYVRAAAQNLDNRMQTAGVWKWNPSLKTQTRSSRLCFFFSFCLLVNIVVPSCWQEVSKTQNKMRGYIRQVNQLEPQTGFIHFISNNFMLMDIIGNTGGWSAEALSLPLDHQYIWISRQLACRRTLADSSKQCGCKRLTQHLYDICLRTNNRAERKQLGMRSRLHIFILCPI